jgi:hypothetical protein
VAHAVPVPEEGVAASGRSAASLAAQPWVRIARLPAKDLRVRSVGRLRAAGKKVDGDVRARTRVRAWPVACADRVATRAAARAAAVRRKAVNSACDHAACSAARRAARSVRKHAHRERLRGEGRRRRGRRRQWRRHGQALDKGDAPLLPEACHIAHPMGCTRARAIACHVIRIPREHVAVARPEAKERKVAAANAGGARGATGLAAPCRVCRVFHESTGHVGGGAWGVAPRRGVCRVGARAIRGKVDGDMDAARLHRVGSARIKWRAICPRAGPIARANGITTATCVRVDRWRVCCRGHLRPEDGTRRRAAGWTSCIVGEDAHAHIGLSRGEGD